MGLSYLGSGGSLITSSIAQLVTFAILARNLGANEFALYVTLWTAMSGTGAACTAAAGAVVVSN